jgi:hypothetical protein
MSYIGTAFTADVANAGAINKLLQSVGAMTAFFITPLFGRHTADPQSFFYEVICFVHHVHFLSARRSLISPTAAADHRGRRSTRRGCYRRHDLPAGHTSGGKNDV